MATETTTVLTKMSDTSPDTTRALSPPTSPTGNAPSAWGRPSPHNSPPARNSPKPSPPTRHSRQQFSGGFSNYFGGDSTYEPIGGGSNTAGGGNPDVEMGRRAGGREALNDFETSLPLRLDYEACLAYLFLPPVGGVLLLVTEWKSDYVRYIGNVSSASCFVRGGLDVCCGTKYTGQGIEDARRWDTIPMRSTTERCFLRGVLTDQRANSFICRFHAWQSALLFSFLFFVHLLFSWSGFMSWVIFVGDLGLIAYLTMRAYLDGMFFFPSSFCFPSPVPISRVRLPRCGLQRRLSMKREKGKAIIAKWISLYALSLVCSDETTTND